MIHGIGIDIVELDRIEKLMERQSRFLARILTEAELKRCGSLSGRRKLEFAAGRFAVKEAFSKAAGTGIGSELSFQDIETASDPAGKPYIKSKLFNSRFHVHASISHSREYAAAQVIIESL
ncbi:holo-ACP synthase [Bacillus marinisedimentorum]|uniref:holo-ACP synthase n=1 Tax=Bacillus marinisedimentorum TaxID=1821260 RepID=UPI000872E2FA|nr:holo-ACP synthase [Bacillus marinisedimentorum]